MNCDLCNNKATVHLCKIYDDVKTEQHLCAEHARKAGLALPSGMSLGQMMVNGVVCSTTQEATVQGILDNFRGMRNFLREHGRMPSSVEDLREGMALPDEGAAALIVDPELAARLQQWDGFVRFIQANGRMPTAEEPGRFGFK